MATNMLTQISSAPETLEQETEPLPQGLDGVAVAGLLQGAVLKGHDPRAILRKAAIDPSVYGDAHAAIDGRALFRLIRQVQEEVDDTYLGFMAQKCRLALDAERARSFLSCTTLGEALRVSNRFTSAISIDIGMKITEKHDPRGSGFWAICDYDTIKGVDRHILVWSRFLGIHHFFSWLIGRLLTVHSISIRGVRPAQANGFDRFAVFRCPIEFEASVDALCYDRSDLTTPLVHHSLDEYADYLAGVPDFFSPPGAEVSWHQRTEHVLADFAREGLWSVSIELVAPRLKTRPRRLSRDLAREGTNFQEIKARLRGELGGAYLLATDLPVTTIGWEVGYRDAGSFTRSFVGWAGMTPSDFRARHKADKARVAAATMMLARHRKP